MNEELTLLISQVSNKMLLSEVLYFTLSSKTTILVLVMLYNIIAFYFAYNTHHYLKLFYLFTCLLSVPFLFHKNVVSMRPGILTHTK